MISGSVALRLPSSTSRRRRRGPIGAAAALAATSLLVAACGGSPHPSARRAGSPGGSITIAAAQEPDCADWIGSCAGEPWGAWALAVETVPKVFLVDQEGNYVPGPVLAQPPKLDPGPPQRVTYFLNPAARWSDGVRITSADLRYTWAQIVQGTDIYSNVGYADIVDVATPSPDEAVATFSKPYAAWRDLFGADQYGILPSHLLAGHDRNSMMKDGYGWSGGPWMLKGGASGWVRGKSMTLVPNPRYWGPKPLLQQVIFDFVGDARSQVEAIRKGQAQVAYTQSDFEVLSQLRGVTGTSVGVFPGINDEAIWFNVQRPPLDRPAVRQALAYSTDRDALVKELFGSVRAGAQTLQSPVPAAWSQVYSPTFSRYRVNLAAVDKLMTGDGWRKGADGIWAKDGRQASFEVKSTSGNARRELMERLLQAQWKAAGFLLTTRNESAGALFNDDLPHGNFQIAIYADIFGARDPGMCSLWCSDNIPAPANGFSGQNWDAIADPSLDSTWGAADHQLDEGKRLQLLKAGQEAVAKLVPFLPVGTIPDVLVWSSRLGGPVSDNPLMGPFWNLENWYLK